jgi:hypothetical protein
MAQANDSKGIINTKVSCVKTQYYPALIDAKQSQEWFEDLKDNIKWHNGHTRMACPLMLGDNETIDTILAFVLSKLNIDCQDIWGIYLNYYRNGNDYTPNHSHKDTKQLVISLGATRILEVGKKKYIMSNGDVILLGSSIHGVPKRAGLNECRISISCFIGNSLKPVNQITIPEQIPNGDKEDLNLINKLLDQMMGGAPFEIVGIQRII